MAKNSADFVAGSRLLLMIIETLEGKYVFLDSNSRFGDNKRRFFEDLTLFEMKVHCTRHRL